MSNYYCGVVCFSFNSVKFCLMYFEALLLSKYTSRIVMFSWWTDPFIITKYLSVFFLIVLKSVLLDVNKVTPAFLSLLLAWYIFFYPLTFKLSVSS